MFGFVVVDKPPGVTSRQAVDAVKKLVRPAKIGHAGTLDPLATGVLVICIGPATRLTQFVQKMPKTYIGEFRFGVSSSTDDTESELTTVDSDEEITLKKISMTLPQFTGDISQRPPNYSAVKIDGKRAYRLSRKGKTVEIQPKIVSVYDIEILDFAYPDLKLKICCGSGTYIRSIGRDLGTALGGAAVMTALNRTAIGAFELTGACSLENLTKEIIDKKICDPIGAFPGANQIVFSAKNIASLFYGHVFDPRELDGLEPEKLNVAIDEEGRFLAVLKKHRKGGYKPELNFVSHWPQYDRTIRQAGN